MTKERAIEPLKEIQFCCDLENCRNAWDCEECVEAWEMAIQALEQEPCDDCIWFQQGVQRTIERRSEQ